MDLLSISRPEDLFEPDPMLIKSKYYELARQWHPDCSSNPNCTTVFAHVTRLHESALRLLNSGVWESKHYSSFLLKDGARVRQDILSRHSVGYGTLSVCKTESLMHLDKAYEGLVSRHVKTIESFKYGSDRMRKQMSDCVPKANTTIVLSDGSLLVRVPLPSGVVSLKDIGPLPPVHVRWIMSSLYNLCCFLEYNRISCGDICTSNVFVHPVDHFSFVPFWCFSHRFGEKIEKLPSHAVKSMPWGIKTSKKADATLDLELVRRLGSAVVKDPDVILSRWLDGTTPNGTTSIKEYGAWISSLESFGPRKYVKLDVNPYVKS